MLLLAGKRITLSKKYMGEMKDEIGDGRYFQTPSELLTKLRTQKDTAMITVSPSRANIPMNDTFYGTPLYNEAGELDGIDYNKNRREASTYKVVYFEKADTKFDQTLHNFFPEYWTVGGTNKPNTGILQQEDFEKYWFLSRISRFIKNSLNAHQNSSKDYQLEIAAPEKDATRERTEGRFRRKAEFLVNEDSSEGGYTIDQLENIGRHLGLPLKQYRNPDQLRKAIMAKGEADEVSRTLSGDPMLKGYEYILMLGNKKGPDYELRELVTQGIENGFVEYNMQRKMFVWKLDGNMVGNICPVDDSAPIKNNVLISFLKHDLEARERLERLLGWGEEEEETPTLAARVVVEVAKTPLIEPAHKIDPVVKKKPGRKPGPKK